MFITFEGPEGSGKSTAIAALARLLEECGHTVLVTRQPGAGEFGAKVRSLLLEGEELDARAELFLFLADRAEHVAKCLRPALEDGVWVLCDRYSDSTVVYQAHARGLSEDFVRSADAFATGGLLPDLTFLLDLDPEVGLSRVQAPDRLDRQPLAFHQAVRAGFLKEAAREPHRWQVLDAAESPEAVLGRILQRLSLSAP